MMLMLFLLSSSDITETGFNSTTRGRVVQELHSSELGFIWSTSLPLPAPQSQPQLPLLLRDLA